MGAGNSSQYEHVFRSAEFKNVYTQFHALKLTTNEIKQLYTHFRNIDVDGGGTVTLEELLVYLDLDTTPYTQRIFTIFDKDGSGEIDFTEFALSMWNYCTLTPSTLDMFAFSLYDMDGSGYLSATEVEAMMHDIYGNSRDSKVESKFLTKNIIQDLHRKERNGDEFNLDDFRAFARDHQALLFPAFQMQFTLQRKVMGYAFWKKHAKRRIALSNGSYVTVENFLSINMRVRKTKQAAQVRDTIDQIGPKFSTADTAGTRVSTGDSTAAAAAAAAAAPSSSSSSSSSSSPSREAVAASPNREEEPSEEARMKIATASSAPTSSKVKLLPSFMRDLLGINRTKKKRIKHEKHKVETVKEKPMRQESLRMSTRWLAQVSNSFKGHTTKKGKQTRKVHVAPATTTTGATGGSRTGAPLTGAVHAVVRIQQETQRGCSSDNQFVHGIVRSHNNSDRAAWGKNDPTKIILPHYSSGGSSVGTLKGSSSNTDWANEQSRGSRGGGAVSEGHGHHTHLPQKKAANNSTGGRNNINASNTSNLHEPHALNHGRGSTQKRSRVEGGHSNSDTNTFSPSHSSEMKSVGMFQRAKLEAKRH